MNYLNGVVNKEVIKQKDLKQNPIQQKATNKAENKQKKKKKSMFRPNSAIKYHNNKKKIGTAVGFLSTERIQFLRAL